MDAKKHRKELEKLIKESDQKAGDSGYDDGHGEEDDAIELLGEGLALLLSMFLSTLGLMSSHHLLEFSPGVQCVNKRIF